MYYRVAMQVDALPHWQWKSTVLSSLATLFQWLRLHSALPQDRLRVFSSSSREGLQEQFAHENQRLASTSETVRQFLQMRKLYLSQVVRQPLAGEGETEVEIVAVAVTAQPALKEHGREVAVLERRREELENGHGGDRDLPYTFTLPDSQSQILAWTTLLKRIRQGELHS